MSRWPSTKAKLIYKALLSIGCSPKAAAGTHRKKGSHKQLQRPGWPDFTWAFHDAVEIGPAMLAKIAQHTGLTPEDL